MPLLVIVAVLSILEFVGILIISTQFPALVMQGNPGNLWWIPTFLAALILIGLVIYYLPRFLRARQGVNIDFVYRELPPE
jgi:hypothetical protein